MLVAKQMSSAISGFSDILKDNKSTWPRHATEPRLALFGAKHNLGGGGDDHHVHIQILLE